MGITEEILASREWRMRELENLRKIGVIDFSGKDVRTKNQYYRMCIPYIYAQWEGYVVEIFRLLIEYLNDLHLDALSVIPELRTFAILNKLRPLSGKQQFESCLDFIIDFGGIYNNPLYIESSNFTTKSNLNYKQLKEILSWFGLSLEITLYKERINQLVHQRNRIAHGENGIVIALEKVSDYITLIGELFDILLLGINSYVTNHEYSL